MAKEHFWDFGKKAVLESVIKNHEIYNDFLNLNQSDVSEKEYSEYSLFNKKPSVFVCTNYGIRSLRAW
jgi:hypothetical protein